MGIKINECQVTIGTQCVPIVWSIILNEWTMLGKEEEDKLIHHTCKYTQSCNIVKY